MGAGSTAHTFLNIVIMLSLFDFISRCRDGENAYYIINQPNFHCISIFKVIVGYELRKFENRAVPLERLATPLKSATTMLDNE